MFDDLLLWPYRAIQDGGLWAALAWLAVGADVFIIFGLILGWSGFWLLFALALRVGPWSAAALFVLGYSYFWGRHHPRPS